MSCGMGLGGMMGISAWAAEGVSTPGARHCASVSTPGSAAAPALSSHCDFSLWFSDEDFLISQQADSLPS